MVKVTVSKGKTPFWLVGLAGVPVGPFAGLKNGHLEQTGSTG
jgi:hypothetical protein